jgi:thiamine pyrophosphate-dependent acetolactate synthase large subunit-like protein
MHNVPVTFVIMNDGRLNMCHHGIKELYGNTPSLALGGVDFAAVASAFGATGRIARDGRDLIEALRLREGPVVIDARIDPDARLPQSARVAALKQFQE